MSNKRTLLEIVQEILVVIDGDEVNSIDDTIESTQVADIVRSTFQAMTSNRNWAHTKKLISFTPSGDTALPTHMIVADDVKELVENSVQYNKAKFGETRKKYLRVNYLEEEAFLRRMNGRNSDNNDIDVIIDPSGVELLIRNDTAPEYWTSFDDKTLVFDSYDSEVESTLQESKVRARAFHMLSFTVVDNFIPNLPEEAFTALIEEAKSRTQVQLHQFNDPKAEQEATRQNNWLSRKQFTLKGGFKYPNYGRVGRKGHRDPTFKQDRSV